MHEMTRDLWAIAKTKGCTAEDFDRYLTASLTKKAEELEKEVTFRTNDPFIGVTVSIPNTRKILGLEVKEEAKCSCDSAYYYKCIKCREAKVDKEEWCEHITWNEYGSARAERGGFWGYSDSQKHPTNICKNWVECPECKAPRPRPKEPKGLWEILRNAFDNSEEDGTDDWGMRAVADAAINWMLEMIENKTPTYSFTEREGIYIDKDELKLNLKESAK